MVIRKMMDWVFSQHDLAWLDDLLPEKEKKKKDEDKKKGKEKDKDKDKEKKKPKAEYSDEEVWNSCPVLLAPCRDETSLKECLIFVCSASVCVCVCSQEKYHSYPNHSPSSDSDMDRRYCVLKLHIPYKDLVYPDVVESQWGAYCQHAAARSVF